MAFQFTREQALLHGMVGVGLIGFLAKLHKWTESAVFFDGSSLGALFLDYILFYLVFALYPH